jgi:DNA-binding XRE family transcriptional regulator
MQVLLRSVLVSQMSRAPNPTYMLQPARRGTATVAAMGKQSGHRQLSGDRARALGDLVRTARTQGGVSQHDLAMRSGISLVHVGRIEGGVSNPSLATMYALAEALDTPAAKLLPD